MIDEIKYVCLADIKYVCSFGTLCHAAQILKNNKLKLCSYPFDWIFSNHTNIIHCIENDFDIFLDKSYYVNLGYNRCAHSYYNKNMFFNHHNPANNENDYNYYIRCVDRFRNLCKSDEHKLFLMIYINLDYIDENEKNNIIDFNKSLSKFINNYTLLVIFQLHNKHINNHNFTYSDNIHFLELHTLSSSTGIVFINNSDNEYINDIIMSTYNFII